MQLASQVGAREQIQIPAHRILRYAQRRAYGRGVPSLPVEMGHHRQKAAHGGGRHLKTQATEIPLNEGLHEALSPSEAVLVGISKERRWEAAAQRPNARVTSTLLRLAR